MHTSSLSDEHLVKIPFTKINVIVMQTDLAALREHVYKLMLVGEVVACHRIKQLPSLPLPEKHAQRSGERIDLIGDIH